MAGKGKIIIEPANGFHCIPERMQKEAQTYLIGKEFPSLDGILPHGFEIGEARVVPRDLPAQVTQVDIIAHWADQRDSYRFIALRAKYVE